MQRVIRIEYSCAAQDYITDVMALTHAEPQPEALNRRVVLALHLKPRVELIFRYLRGCVSPPGAKHANTFQKVDDRIVRQRT